MLSKKCCPLLAKKDRPTVGQLFWITHFLCSGKAKSEVFRIYRRRLTCGRRHVFESFRKILILTVLMFGSLWLHFFVLNALLPYVYMVRCGRPAVFVWLCKLHTIEDHVLYHATIASSTNIIKAEESRRLHVVLYGRACSMCSQSTV